MNSSKTVFLIVLIFLVAVGCDRPEVISDLSGRSFELLDQDSSAVNFPDDFRNEVTVVGFIYTHCPDVCPAITANMSTVNRELENPENVHFVGVTFDPQRDRPSVLKEYMKQFNLNENQFTFVTGDTITVDSLLNVMNIRAVKSYSKTTEDGKNHYFMNHTNRISVLDQQGRIRLEYSGSFSKPEQIIDGINNLR